MYIFPWLSVHVCVCFECMCVCVHSDEAGEAAWRLIHHFPPWPAVPSAERCAVTVTLGSFWSRKMVHPPPASPPPPPPPPPSPSSKPAGLDAAVAIPLTVSDCFPRRQPYTLYPRGQIANQRQRSLEGPSFVHSRFVELLQVGRHVRRPSLPLAPCWITLEGVGEGRQMGGQKGWDETTL